MNYSIISETNSVSLQEAKLYLRIDNNSEDSLLASLIGAAQTYCREYVCRNPFASVIDFNYVNWSGKRCNEDYENLEASLINGGSCQNQISLPFSTATAATLYYRDTAGVEQTVSASDYSLTDLNSISTLVYKSSFSYPTLDTNTPLPVRIKVTYSANAKEAQAFKILVLSLVAYWYTNREPVITGSIATKLPITFDALASSIRTGAFLR